MYFLIKLIVQKHKHLLLIKSWVSKCGFHIFNMKKKGQVVLYSEHTRFHKSRFKGCKANDTQLCFCVHFFFSQIINRSSIKDMKTFTYIMNGVKK